MTSETIINHYHEHQPTYRPPIDLPGPASRLLYRPGRFPGRPWPPNLQPGRVITLAVPAASARRPWPRKLCCGWPKRGNWCGASRTVCLFHSFYQDTASDQAFQYVAAMYGETETPVPAVGRRRCAGRQPRCWCSTAPRTPRTWRGARRSRALWRADHHAATGPTCRRTCST